MHFWKSDTGIEMGSESQIWSYLTFFFSYFLTIVCFIWILYLGFLNMDAAALQNIIYIARWFCKNIFMCRKDFARALLRFVKSCIYAHICQKQWEKGNQTKLDKYFDENSLH